MKRPTAETAIIKALKDASDRYVSGEDLAVTASMSRAAIWKHIKTLREKGYDIEAFPRRGYRLLSVPDRLFPEEITPLLSTKTIGTRIIYFACTESTNNEAKALAEKGAGEGLVVIAEEQSGGKGRLDRYWVSPPGGIWLSVIVRPEITPAHVSRFSIMSAVAVAKTIEILSIKPQIKWPNDVLINGKKVCGILLELTAQPDRVGYIVIGIGINANIEQESIPPENRDNATTLSAVLGSKMDRPKFVSNLLLSIECEYARLAAGDWQGIKNDWMNRCPMLGEQVTLGMLNGEVTGRFVDIDDFGALMLESAQGDVKSYSAGDVTVKKKAP